MYIDLHCHLNFTRKAKFSIKTFRRYIKVAKLNGLTAIALTEHFDADIFQEIYEELEKHYEYKHEYFDVNGFKVFSGMEVDVIGKRQYCFNRS